MSLLRILVLSDGRPGHFNLSEGIAAAIERLGPAATYRQEVRRGRWSGSALAAMTRTGLPAASMLHAVYGLSEADVAPSDIIVSAGAETLAANIWLARARGVPNVFYGSLRLFSPADFSLILTSYERASRKFHHVRALKPSRLDPDNLPKRSLSKSDRPTFGLLIGGDAGGVRYAAEDWRRLVDLVSTAGANHRIRWRIANSRRTPARANIQLTEAASTIASPIIEFLDARSSPAGTLPGLLAQCDAMVCTADSSSMVSECIWARKPTIALAPRDFELPPDEADYRLWLDSQGWCRHMPLSEMLPDRLLQVAQSLTPIEHNPLELLASTMRQAIPGLSAPMSHPI